MRRYISSAALAIGLLGGAIAPALRASEWDKETRIKVDQPIEVPGTVLSAGTYVFRLIASYSDLYTVQVLNERKDHVFATVLAIPNSRPKPTDKTILTFYEVSAGQPHPVRTWFYPGDLYGEEFVYPKERGVSISDSSSTTATPRGPVAESAPQPEAEPASIPASADKTL